MTDTGAAAAPAQTERNKRQILEALSGMLLAMFVAILSNTIVANALPTIITDLRGTQTQYTWVVTATLLATTASTPIWGKLADLFSKKLLVQLAITIFVLGSVLAGFSTSLSVLIGWRALQGIGAGGLQALVQVVIAAIIPPRERGRYSGYLGAVFGTATVAGPLLGGLIVDTPWLGWRWCFFVGVPVGLLALVVLQKTLHVPTITREVHIDYLGAALITGGVTALLIWASLGGQSFAWDSGVSLVLVSSGVVALVLALIVESRAREPILPLWLFTERTVVLSALASLVAGMVMFGAVIFLSQYFQISRGFSPTTAGLLTLPLILGLFASTTVSGQLISRFGRWKPYLVLGAVLVTTGMALLTTIDHTTPLPRLSTYLALVGVGVGMLMQNLVLAVQNTVDVTEIGVASSVVAFLRSLGGTIGVTAIGVILDNRVTALVTERTGVAAGLNDLPTAPPPVAMAVGVAYGDAMATAFLVTAVASIGALLAVLFIKEVPLRTTIERSPEPAATAVAAGAAPSSSPPVPLAVNGGHNGSSRDGARDRLIALLLPHPDETVAAVREADRTRAEIAMLHELLESRRRDLDAARERLRRLGLTDAQVTALFDGDRVPDPAGDGGREPGRPNVRA